MPVSLTLLARRLFVSPQPGFELTLPGLVWEAPPNSTTDSGHWAMTDAGQSPTRPRAGEPLVFMVEKLPGSKNPFAMGVTIGRVDSNDVVLDDASVSRFHAWLQQDERSKDWNLTDAESKNGTWVDGKQVAPKARVTLKDGTVLKFGDVELKFLLPKSLTGFIEQRYRGGK